MIEPAEIQPGLQFQDKALDAGVAAWFSVRKVRADRPFLRDRMHAAVAAVLVANAQRGTNEQRKN